MKYMIKFAYSSSIVRKMVQDGESDDEIRLYIAGTKFRKITGNPELTDAQVLKTVSFWTKSVRRVFSKNSTKNCAI